MAIVVCELCWDYDVGAWDDEILLWSKEARVDSVAHYDDIGGDDDDVTDCTILLWCDFTYFGGSEFIDTPDFAVGDGAHVHVWVGGRIIGCGSGGGVVRNFIIKIPYCGGEVVWRDEAVFGGNTEVPRSSVFSLFGGGGIIIGWLDMAKAEKKDSESNYCNGQDMLEVIELKEGKC